MILDGEENKAMRILLKQRLAGLELLDSRSSLGSFDSLVDLAGLQVDVGDRRVFLASGFEVELLRGGIAHLQVLERRGSLEDIVRWMDRGRVYHGRRRR